MTTLSRDLQPIAALASGSGPGAVGVIRASGPGLWSLVAPCLGDAHAAPPLEKKLVLRQFRKPQSSEVIDELMVAWFCGPRSYTGEDTVELFCHGGPFIISEILSTLFQQGVRPADPGEFTKRALLNGKLDLTAAEGIKDLVEAQSRQQWLAGRQLYSGRLRLEIETLRSVLIEAMAWLEAMIDFPDEGDTANVHLEDVKARVKRVDAQISNLVDTFQSGQIASQGLRVAFAGPPNAGKSTLLNTLLGHERALVSDVAGTTRDYIEEKCLIEGRLVRLIDMAGLRETDDKIEKAGVVLSKKLILEADVVVGLFASDSTEEERRLLDEVLAELGAKATLRLVTKSDLADPTWGRGFLKVSCEANKGITEFKQDLARRVDSHLGRLSEDPFITSARQQQCLVVAKTALSQFWHSLESKAGHELLAFELQEAARALSNVIGELSNEDILHKVFSDFCIGK